MTRSEPGYDVVIPTVGRPQLSTLLEGLGREARPRPHRIVIVDDRAERHSPLLSDEPPPEIASRLRVISSGARGPAAARNLGWRSCSSPWIVFLDDDVVPGPDWGSKLLADLVAAPPEVIGMQGAISVPRETTRPQTDWERNVAGLENALWATADMAYRSWALSLLGGFDERFPRAYREDADLALRAMRFGFQLVEGQRLVLHPVRPGRRFDSIRRQNGNADDALMTMLHGPGWRSRAGMPPGRRPRHLLSTGLALAGLGDAARGNRWRARWWVGAWLAATAHYAWARIRPGPRGGAEIFDMVVTSAVIPAAATWHWLTAWVRMPRVLRRRNETWEASDRLVGSIEAVLFDRDGTLVRDLPYNGDPSSVCPLPGARRAVGRLRQRGLKLGVITNQSGIGRGFVSEAQVAAVNERVDRLLGPFDLWALCPHRPDEGCECRKPEPGLVLKAATELGVPPERCLVIGDIGSDMEAARKAGSAHVLVPTSETRPEEIRAEANVAADLDAAVDRIEPRLRGAAR